MKKLIIALSLVLGLSACGTRAPFSPPQAFLYSDFKAPLSTEVNKTDLGSKVGESSSVSILGLVTVGDLSVQKAARDGRIKTVKHIDYKHFNFLFLQKTTTVVYGD